MNPQTTTQQPMPQRFDVPMLQRGDTLRAVARHDATAERRRHDAGFQEGRVAGLAQGQAEVAAAIEDHRGNAERLGVLCQALDAALAQVRQHELDSVTAIEEAIVALSIDVAESLVHREITDHQAVVDVIGRCLQLHAGDQRVARVHPDDMKCAVDARRAGLIGGDTSFELVADASVQRGGCLLDGGSTRFDAQVAPAVERVRRALRPADSAGSGGLRAADGRAGHLLDTQQNPAQSFT